MIETHPHIEKQMVATTAIVIMHIVPNIPFYVLMVNIGYLETYFKNIMTIANDVKPHHSC